MKTKKAFLAKVLAAAVTITSILPGGALTANAATIKDTTDGWKVERTAGNWSGEFDDGVNLGGIQTWRLITEKRVTSTAYRFIGYRCSLHGVCKGH